ncbi:hypothetical protein Tco_0814935 [Tanacetum coccineum]
MITSMGICHAKAYTLRGRSSTKLGQRLSKTWQSSNHHKKSSIPLKPDRAHIFPISGAIQANYEVLESLLRERRRQIRNEDLRTELEYFSEDYDEEREMKPRPEPHREATLTLRPREGSRRGRNTEGIRPSEIKERKDENRGANLPPLLAAHLERNKSCQPLRSSLTSPFIPSSLHTPTGLVPIHVNPYSQPSAGLVNGQTLNFPFQTQICNPPAGGISTYHPQGGIYHKLSPTIAYLHAMGLCSFADSTGSVTPFVRWIEDYPLSDGLKMPSHIGSYDGRGDPDNFLHLLEGVIRMQKCQQKKFTKTHLVVHNIKQREGESTRAFITRYTDDTLQVLGLHEEQRISGFVHGLRTRSLVEHLSTDLPSTYMGLMEKTYTWIEAREVATNETPNDRRENFERARRSSWDNNQGQKGMDRFTPYRGPNHGLPSNLSKSPREILATEKAAKSFEQPLVCLEVDEAMKSGQISHLVKGIKKERVKASENQRTKGKKDKSTAPAEAPILMIRQDESYTKNKFEGLTSKGKEITFPSGEHPRRCPSHKKGNSQLRDRKSDFPYNMLLGRKTMLKMGIVASTIHGAIKFHTTERIGTVFSTYESGKVKERVKKVRETPPASEKGVFNCTTEEEKVVVNNKYSEQTVTIGKQLPEHFKG